MNLLRENPARVYGLVVALLSLAGHYVELPDEHILAVVGAALALLAGEAVQRVEDVKTAEAFVRHMRR